MSRLVQLAAASLLLLSASVANADLLPRDARALRTFFRERSTTLSFTDPALSSWYAAMSSGPAGDPAATLKLTDDCVAQGKLTPEQADDVLAFLDEKHPLLTLALTPGQTSRVTQWKLARLQSALYSGQAITPPEQDFVWARTPPSKQTLLARELARTQQELAPAIATAWTAIQKLTPAEQTGFLCLVDAFGPEFRNVELYLAGRGGALPLAFTAPIKALVDVRIALERQWQSPAVPAQDSLADYLRAWQRFAETQRDLRIAASAMPRPFSDIVHSFIQQPLHTHWNHLVIAYLQACATGRGGAEAVSRLVADYQVPAPEFSSYLLNPSNLWLLNQAGETVLVPFAEWLLTQNTLPVADRAALDQLLHQLGRARAYDTIIALGQKARSQMASTWLDEWGQYAMLRGYISSGSYPAAKNTADQMARNGGCKEFSQGAWLQAAIAAYYLAGDYRSAQQTAWEQFALFPHEADRPFLSELSIHQGDAYAGSFLRRLSP